MLRETLEEGGRQVGNLPQNVQSKRGGGPSTALAVALHDTTLFKKMNILFE